MDERIIKVEEIQKLKREIKTYVDVDRRYEEGWNAALDHIIIL